MTDSAHEQHEQPVTDDFGLSVVRELLRLISETDVTEIQIERSGAKLHIKRGVVAQGSAPFLITPSLAAAVQPTMHSPLPPIAPFQQAGGADPAQPTDAATQQAQAPTGELITAPMVGTFYAGPSPKDPPYAQEGDTIQPGDRVGIIETMKMMNEIESEIGGRIARILVKNGQPVEYGQPLMLVEPL
jgi:acetyl-CoA carboxylase biotin carboxyl carrier protein